MPIDNNKRKIRYHYYKVEAKYALFTTPDSKQSGDRKSYPIPTRSAMIGLTNRIFSKPQFDNVVDAIRILKPISMETLSPVTKIKDGIHIDTRDMFIYNVLKDVAYMVKCHIEIPDEILPHLNTPQTVISDLRSYWYNKLDDMFDKRLKTHDHERCCLGCNNHRFFTEPEIITEDDWNDKNASILFNEAPCYVEKKCFRILFMNRFLYQNVVLGKHGTTENIEI